MSSSPTHRRPFLLALAGGAVAVTGIGVAARTGVLSDRGDHEPGATAGLLRLSAGATGVDALEVALDDGVLAEDGRGQWRSARLATTTHSMVGFTWRRGEVEPHIDISSRIDGVWQPWQRIPHVHDMPDADSHEVTDTVGTELVWTGAADGIRLRVRGSRPADFKLVLLYPTALPSDRLIASNGDARVAGPARARASAAQTSEGSVPGPELLTRRDWGANEAWRNGRPQYNETIKQVHVHHTANSNDYTRADVPALIRGIYAYHTQSLGWSDIAYNFLVDRFGRIWVGRAGGPGRPVRGAHTLGFNGTSTGISVIGNYDLATPTAAVIGAIARVAAWKLDMYGRDPQGRITVRSEGSDKYRANRRVTLPVIDGHRDTNDTECPGQKLYAALPAVRRRTRARMDRFAQKPQAAITEPFTVSGTTVDGEQLTVRPGAWTPADAAPTYTWLRDGGVIRGATAATYRLTSADVGSRIGVRVEVAGKDVQPATQSLTFPSAVKARPTLAVRAVGLDGRAAVRVVATAAGLDGPVTGSVRITLAGRSRSVELVDGRARVVFWRLRPGTYQAQVAYPGNDGAAAASGGDSVTVGSAAST